MLRKYLGGFMLACLLAILVLPGLVRASGTSPASPGASSFGGFLSSGALFSSLTLPVGCVFRAVLPGISSDGYGYPCTVDAGQRINVNTHPGAVPSAGAGQVGLAVTTATNLTPPAGAVSAIIQCTGDVYWRDDGTAPTSSTGIRLAAWTPLPYAGSLSAIQFIQVSSATCSAMYYK